MKGKTKTGIVVLIMLLAIGFASISATLLINGSGTIGYNSNNFDIYFSAASATNGTAEREEGYKTITFETDTLTELNEEAFLDYTITNESYDYDAEGVVTLDLNPESANGDVSLQDYIEITMIGFEENKNIEIRSRSSSEGRIKIKLIEIPSQPLELKFTVSLNFNPIQREEVGGNPNNSSCVSDGYYQLMCDCGDGVEEDIGWLDGPYFDQYDQRLDSLNTQDEDYPAPNTFACTCANNGDPKSGYVVNTGNLVGTICETP